MLLGIYEPQDDMEVTSQPRLANFYYWSYTMIAFFILLNALLAIVVDAYAACKSEADSQAEIVGAPYPYVRLASVHADFEGPTYFDDGSELLAFFLHVLDSVMG